MSSIYVDRMSECPLYILSQDTIHYVARVSECPLYSTTGYHTLNAACGCGVRMSSICVDRMSECPLYILLEDIIRYVDRVS